MLKPLAHSRLTVLTTSASLAVPPFAEQVNRRTGPTVPCRSIPPYVVSDGEAKLLQTWCMTVLLKWVILLSSVLTMEVRVPLVLTSMVSCNRFLLDRPELVGAPS